MKAMELKLMAWYNNPCWKNSTLPCDFKYNNMLIHPWDDEVGSHAEVHVCRHLALFKSGSIVISSRVRNIAITSIKRSKKYTGTQFKSGSIVISYITMGLCNLNGY